jgi:hypothetical protein
MAELEYVSVDDGEHFAEIALSSIWTIPPKPQDMIMIARQPVFQLVEHLS